MQSSTSRQIITVALVGDLQPKGRCNKTSESSVFTERRTLLSNAAKRICILDAYVNNTLQNGVPGMWVKTDFCKEDVFVYFLDMWGLSTTCSAIIRRGLTAWTDTLQWGCSFGSETPMCDCCIRNDRNEFFLTSSRFVPYHKPTTIEIWIATTSDISQN